MSLRDEIRDYANFKEVFIKKKKIYIAMNSMVSVRKTFDI